MNPVYIIVLGDVVDGFTFSGPFTTRQDAIDHAERWSLDTWVVAELERPAPGEWLEHDR